MFEETLWFLRRKLLKIFWPPPAARAWNHDAKNYVILQKFWEAQVAVIPQNRQLTISVIMSQHNIRLFDHGITLLYHDSSRVGQLIKFIKSVLSDTQSAPAKSNVFHYQSVNRGLFWTIFVRKTLRKSPKFSAASGGIKRSCFWSISGNRAKGTPFTFCSFLRLSEIRWDQKKWDFFWYLLARGP